MKYIITFLLWLCWMLPAYADVELKAVYPYSMTNNMVNTVRGESTIPLYVELTAKDLPDNLQSIVEVELPEHFTALQSKGWRLSNAGRNASIKWNIPAYYGRCFDLLYIKADSEAASGKYNIKVRTLGESKLVEKEIAFTFVKEIRQSDKSSQQKQAEKAQNTVSGKRKKVDKSKFNWYIQEVRLPVDSQGRKDDKAADGVVYVRDTSLEGFRNRVVGDGVTNWAAVFAHPACHLLLDMRNPQQDVRVLKFKAELLDKKTGQLVPGLCTSGKVSEDNESGWAESKHHQDTTTALISLDGKKMQTFVLPLYVDYLQVLEGDYNLRVTVSGNGQEKITELPLTITKKHNLGLVSVAVAFASFLIVILFARRICNCINEVGAKGAITIALFAALAFGGITLPTTILGDFLHVFLGPFSGLITGLLSGILQYLLIMALVILYRRPGVLALMYIVRFLLAGLMFGHFTPIGVLSCCVNIAFLETVLWFSGFYIKKDLQSSYMLMLCLLMGVTDAAITFVNLEQMMFFYRLYYADWYLALYMIINGFVYSSLGSWFGYRTGTKLRQVMGE